MIPFSTLQIKLAILSIRYPIYAAAVTNDSCPNGYIFLTGSIVFLFITYSLDFVIMPLLFRRIDPIGKDIIRSKVSVFFSTLSFRFLSFPFFGFSPISSV